MLSQKFTVREAQSADFEQIYIINRDDLGYDYPPEKTERKLAALINSHSDRVFVAVSGETVIGYVHASDYDVIYADHMKDIMGIAVASEFRGMGVGAALLRAVEEWAKASGAAGIRVNSGSSRTGAHEFYRRCGYTNEKQQHRFLKMI